MVSYWHWMSRKVISHFADSKQVKKLLVILLILGLKRLKSSFQKV